MWLFNLEAAGKFGRKHKNATGIKGFFKAENSSSLSSQKTSDTKCVFFLFFLTPANSPIAQIPARHLLFNLIMTLSTRMQ